MDSRNNDSSNIICYYRYEQVHTKRQCKKLQNRNQRIQTTNITITATVSSFSKKTIMVLVAEYARLSQFQESLKRCTPATTSTESGKRCFIFLSNK